jgi:phage repressor protein C with HTH and peptisase S24 domain
LPGVSGSGYVAFPIKGNSMDPIINNGDIIVCQEIGSFHEIKENEIYAVRSNGSVWVKYIKCIKNNSGRVVQLKLISANYLEHDPFVEDVNEYTKIFKVIKRISTL